MEIQISLHGEFPGKDVNEVLKEMEALVLRTSLEGRIFINVKL